MDAKVCAEATDSRPQHKRTTSSVLKSMMSPKRGTPAGTSRAELRSENLSPNKLAAPVQSPILPTDHPQARYHLKEQSNNRDNTRSSPRKTIEIHDDNAKSTGLHKKTKSSVSLKSLIGTEKVKTSKPRSSENQEAREVKKSKSSTSLSALLSRPKSSKGTRPGDSPRKKDKENLTPPSSANAAPTPIWAQFATHQLQEATSTMKIPLNDRKYLADEIALYTPQDYSPSKQRNFHDCEKPTLSRGAEPKARPKSAYVPLATSKSTFAGTVAGLRKSSLDRNGRCLTKDGSNRRVTSATKSSSQRSSLEYSSASRVMPKSDIRTAQRGSRVMAAVAAFDGKSREPTQGPHREAQKVELNVKAIENAFESLLVSIRFGQSPKYGASLIVSGCAKCPATHSRQDEILRHQHQGEFHQARQDWI